MKPNEVPSAIRSDAEYGKSRVLDVEARSDVASPSLAKMQASMNVARGTPIESALLNPAMLALAGAPANVRSTAPRSRSLPLGSTIRSSGTSSASFAKTRSPSAAPASSTRLPSPRA
jgi:hypothetical protein